MQIAQRVALSAGRRPPRRAHPRCFAERGRKYYIFFMARHDAYLLCPLLQIVMTALHPGT
jgi:hypothetical protein